MVIRIVCPLYLRMDISLILRIWEIFRDEEEGQWEEVEPSKDVQTDVRTECVVNDHMSFLSTIGHNSDIADMGDFRMRKMSNGMKLRHPKTYKRRYGRVV